MVEVDEADEADEMDDAELDRWRPFRPNMPLTSSVIGVAGWPPLLPHAGLLRGKDGGFATAVIRESRGGEGAWLGDGVVEGRSVVDVTGPSTVRVPGSRGDNRERMLCYGWWRVEMDKDASSWSGAARRVVDSGGRRPGRQETCGSGSGIRLRRKKGQSRIFGAGLSIGAPAAAPRTTSGRGNSDPPGSGMRETSGAIERSESIGACCCCVGVTARRDGCRLDASRRVSGWRIS